MKPLRISIIGVLSFLILAGIWVVFFNLHLFPSGPLARLQPYKDYILIGLEGIVLFAVTEVQRRMINQEETNRRKAREESVLQRHYADALMQTAAHANSKLNLSSTLESICEEAARVLDAEAVITLYRPQRGTIELAAVHGWPADLQESFEPVPVSASFMQIASQDKPLILSGQDQELLRLPYGELYQKRNFTALAYFPLIYHENFLGGLTILTLDGMVEFTPDQLALIKTFSDLAAQAIRADRLSMEVRESTQKLEILRTGDIAILSSLDLTLTLKVFLQQVKEQLNVDAADVLLLNSGTQLLEYAYGIGFLTSRIKETKIPLGTSYAGKIALERRSMYLSNIKMDGPFTLHRLVEGEGFLSYYGIPLIAKAQVKGVLEVFQRSPFYPDDSWLSFLETLAGQAAIAIDNSFLFTSLNQMNTDLTIAYDRTLEGWSRALDMRDKETEGHTQRVTSLTLQLAQELNIRENEMIHIRRGALLHDIGKMGIPDSILLKPDELTEEEQKIMKMHPQYAFEMISPINYLASALDIPYCHHEKWDGSGYPRGLKGEVIPLAARIFAVVDVWDALTSDRPYRKAMPKEEALQYLREQAGKHFDPNVADAFVRLVH